MSEQYIAFGDRLRQIRKEMGFSQEELAQKLGTSKQVLSRYETNQRAPKITLVKEYAEKLGISVDYMLGDTPEEAVYAELRTQPKKEPFYKIFMDIIEELGMNIPDTVRATGLTDRQVRTIIIRQMKDAPLPIALQLSDRLEIPLEVWAGDMPYTPTDLSPEAREVAHAYDKASDKEKNMVRVALDLSSWEGRV